MDEPDPRFLYPTPADALSVAPTWEQPSEPPHPKGIEWVKFESPEPALFDWELFNLVIPPYGRDCPGLWKEELEPMVYGHGATVTPMLEFIRERILILESVAEQYHQGAEALTMIASWAIRALDRTPLDIQRHIAEVHPTWPKMISPQHLGKQGLPLLNREMDALGLASRFKLGINRQAASNSVTPHALRLIQFVIKLRLFDTEVGGESPPTWVSNAIGQKHGPMDPPARKGSAPHREWLKTWLDILREGFLYRYPHPENCPEFEIKPSSKKLRRASPDPSPSARARSNRPSQRRKRIVAAFVKACQSILQPDEPKIPIENLVNGVLSTIYEARHKRDLFELRSRFIERKENSDLPPDQDLPVYPYPVASQELASPPVKMKRSGPNRKMTKPKSSGSVDQNQERFLRKRARALPKLGCPGKVSEDTGFFRDPTPAEQRMLALPDLTNETIDSWLTLAIEIFDEDLNHDAGLPDRIVGIKANSPNRKQRAREMFEKALIKMLKAAPPSPEVAVPAVAYDKEKAEKALARLRGAGTKEGTITGPARSRR